MSDATLAGLSIRPAYHKGQDDIAVDFYLPTLARSVRYDRAVGFFSSSIYAIAWPSLRSFVEAGGRMRLLCSPVLSEGDITALQEGYDEGRAMEAAGRDLSQQLRLMLADPRRQKPTRVLASLVSAGILEFKIAFLTPQSLARSKRIFHDKVGLMGDTAGNWLVFKGSMNETWTGLSNDGNLESVDVFVSWASDRERERVQDERTYFDALWEDRYPTARVKAFPDVATAELIAAAEADWPRLVEEIAAELEIPAVTPVAGAADGPARPAPKTPRKHQADAISGWEAQGRRGILEHATASGKTLTALWAMQEALRRGEVPLVVVPSDILLGQWEKEIRSVFLDSGLKLLICGGGHDKWRRQLLLGPWTNGNTHDRVVLASLQTASTPEFLQMIRGGDHLFLVADECHRVGSPEYSRLLGLESGPRLGLSATPRRAGDPEGTRLILDYFGPVVPPPFTLADGIRLGLLTPYMYYVHPVHLLADEQEEWNALTKKIGQLFAVEASGRPVAGSENSYLDHLLIHRARILKQAAEKVPLALDVVRSSYVDGQRWLVYCDSMPQLTDVLDLLRAHDLPASAYHSAMDADKAQTLRHFDLNGGILVSIRCLDEGVDIPSVTHALILASSKNPREFIQRRGRVLRLAPGKAMAFVHDALVMPRDHDPSQKAPSLIEAELARAIVFGDGAMNPGVVTDLKAIALDFGIDYNSLVEAGMEADDE